MEKSKLTLGSVRLSSREAEVAELIHAGLTSKQMAYRLDLAENTTKIYCNNLYKKLGLTKEDKNYRVMVALMWEREIISLSDGMVGLA